ncbi:MAG: amino acid permease [Williamsia sp.]|nr:amino acid permease [Williamsia sp.]
MSNPLFRKKSVDAILADAHSGFSDAEHSHSDLKRDLGVKDLTAMGIAAVIGAGIFSTIGKASFEGGPGVSLLFVITAVCCGFSALCYAEFASRIPVSGSAYTYAYASFGELVAWIIGWDLLMEYAIGNIAVAISWSQYFNNLLKGLNINIPAYFTTDYLSAYRGFTQATADVAGGAALKSLPEGVQSAYQAWISAPQIGGLRIIADLPALLIVLLITYLVYIGISETRKATNLMVALKLVVILVVIAIGFFYVAPANWSPFLPNGFGGMMKGVSAVFFAYIGFDAISTTAEECRNPQRDLPRGMIASLIICTILYILIALVLTGMVSYKQLNVGDPLASVFSQVGLNKLSYVISFSAVIATASVILVFQMGQPRIWMSMSRDGLLPKVFSRIHPKYKTPSFSTIITGMVVAIPALFLNLTEVTDLTSIGTLFAFVLVCGGVLLLPKSEVAPSSKKFTIKYINGKWIVPVLYVVGFIVLWKNLLGLFHYENEEHFKDKLPFFLFIILATVLTVLTFMRNLSLIPVLGLASCFYLMTELGYINWLRFLIWLVIGLVIYFLYGRRHSRLARPAGPANNPAG